MRLKSISIIAIVFIVIIGFTLRLLLPKAGHNCDFESYVIVSDIVSHGENVYEKTERYNYSPIWFTFLYGVRTFFPKIEDFRIAIVAALALADFAIAFLLARRVSPLIGILYFMSPISIFITGYHNQFDNLSILAALGSVILLERHEHSSGAYKRIPALLLLGLSIAIKHTFIFFPFWLAFRKQSWNQRLLTIFLPIGLFGITFLPYLSAGHSGIINNVVLYTSLQNAPLLSFLSFGLFHNNNAVAFLFFLVAIFFVGWRIRRESHLFSFALFGATFVAFSPAIVNQYLIIPLLFTLLMPNFWGFLATGIAISILLLHPDGLGLAIKNNEMLIDFYLGVYFYAAALAISIITVLAQSKKYFPQRVL